ncbi:MAG: response regulator transcription factor [Bacteroidales bacterium]|nr:response regulator transcription factor [Bacteroidales bacterium]
MDEKKRVLVVDDEVDICEILKFNLELEGYIVDTANSSEEAMLLQLEQYDLFLLDIMMGEISGLKFGKQIRQNPATAQKPIIFITAKDTENDVIMGLSVGADDYISKPFSIKEVQLRVAAVLRRTFQGNKAENEQILSYNTLSIDLNKKLVIVDNIEIELTKKEFEILSLLVSKPKYVFSREEILKAVWTDEVCVLDRTIDVNITRLRKKIEPYGKCITTRLGYGYSFEKKL